MVETLRALFDKEHADGERCPLDTETFRGEIVGAIREIRSDLVNLSMGVNQGSRPTA